MTLEHAFFIGGSPCAGKSTVCDLLAQKHGFRAYHCDDHYDAHLERATGQQPTLSGFRGRALIELMTRPLEVMLHDELEANRELGSLAIEDLQAIQGRVIAEGMPFMPDVIARLEPTAKIVYLVPTEAFQREHYAGRDWAWTLAGQSPDPQRMFETWMTRDAHAARWVAGQARALGFPVLEVDGSLTVLETLGWCEQWLALA